MHCMWKETKKERNDTHLYIGPTGGAAPPAETRVGVPNELVVTLLPPFGPLATGPPVELISCTGDDPPVGRSAPEGVGGEDEEEGRP